MRAIFGMGCGRCGSKSLAYVLNEQDKVWMAHEYKPILPFDKDEEMLDKKLSTLRRKGRNSRSNIYGDIGHYYLWYIDQLIDRLPNIKIICLYRERSEVVQSYWIKVHKRSSNQEPLYGKMYKNFWQDDPNRYTSDWDKAFPKFGLPYDIKEVVGQYHDFYYGMVHQYIDKYPDHIRIFDIDCLNSVNGLEKIFNFCGIMERTYLSGIKIKNRWSEVRNE